MIGFVLGTRAQLIKMAPLILAVEQLNLSYEIVWTGQHHETIADLKEDFGLKQPFVNLTIDTEVNSVGRVPAWAFTCLKNAFGRERNRFKRYCVIVTHGDTFSTILAGLIGKLLRIPVAHVESGLRSWRLFHPFPEEINRLLTFQLSSIAYCPGDWAIQNLCSYPRLQKINTLANTLIDAVRIATSTPAYAIDKMPGKSYVVCSIHRFENLFSTERLAIIIDCVEAAAKQFAVYFILHPATHKRLLAQGHLARLKSNPAIQLTNRMGYISFIALLGRAEFVMTDGGSNQEELHYLGKPTALMREASERQEGIGKNALLVGCNLENFKHFLANYLDYASESITESASPAKLIAEDLKHRFPSTQQRLI